MAIRSIYHVRETVWGPVLDDVDYPDGEIAVSWIAHKPEGVNLRLIDLETAASVERGARHRQYDVDAAAELRHRRR